MSFRWEEFSEDRIIRLIKIEDDDIISVIGLIKKSTTYFPGKYYYVDIIDYYCSLNGNCFDTIEECKYALMERRGICYYRELSREEGLVVYEF